MLEPSICAFPLLTRESTCFTLCGLCDHGSRSDTCGAVIKRGLSLSCSSGSGRAQGCWQIPPDRISTRVACIAIPFFVSWHWFSPSCLFLPPPSPIADEQPAVYSLPHCSQLCCNHTHIWFSWYSYLGNLILVWNCCYGYLGAAGLARLLLKMCCPLHLSVRLSHFSSSPLFGTCATQLSLTAVPVTFVSFSHGFLSRPSIYHAMLCSLPCPCQLAEPLLELSFASSPNTLNSVLFRYRYLCYLV